MKKFTKFWIFAGAIAISGAPIATLVSCGDDKKEVSSSIQVAANKEWVSEYKKIAKAFNEAHSDSKYKIVIKEQKDSDIEWEKKSVLDESVPDIFTVDNPNLEIMKANEYLTPFANVKVISDFEKKYFDDNNDKKADHEFVNEQIAASVNKDDKIYAVPFNTEAQLAIEVGKTSPAIDDSTKLGPSVFSKGYLEVAAPQELFKVAGFVQTPDSTTGSNQSSILGNIIAKDGDSYTSGLTSGSKVETVIKNLYSKFIKPLNDAATSLTGESQTHYNNIYDSDFMTMIVGQEDSFIDMVKDKKASGWKLNGAKPRLFFGTWRTADIMKKLKTAKVNSDNVHIYAPAKYHQYLGGWAYVINKRLADNSEKTQVATDFIGELLKAKYANDLARVTSKPSPLSSITWNTGDELMNKSYEQIAIASNIAIKRLAVDKAADKATFDLWGPVFQQANKAKLNSSSNLLKSLETSLTAKLSELNAGNK